MADNDKIKGYPRDIDAEARDIFYNSWAAFKERTTEIRIKALRRDVDEQKGLLSGLFKQLTISFSPFVRLDEKLQERDKKKKT